MFKLLRGNYMAAKSTKGRKNSKSRPKKGQQNTELRGEIIILAALAVCILLVLSNFGVGGIVGEAVSSVFFGLFGFMAYLLPFILFAVTAFFVSNKGNAHAYIKIGAAVMLFLFITAILELIFNSYTPGASLISYYQAASEHRNAGGLTGGCLISMLCPLIGVIGTYVVLVILSVICLILITEKSLLAPIGRQSRKAYEDAKKKHQETAVIRAKEREERQKTARLRQENNKKQGSRRSDNKVSGVSFATTLGEEETTGKGKRRGRKKSPDVYELIPEEMPENDSFQFSAADSFVINRAEPQDIPAEEAEDNSFRTDAVQTDAHTRPEEATDAEKPAKRRSKAKETAEVSAETENVAAAVEKEQAKERSTNSQSPESSQHD
jgi:S-DNA-T family DNA segregation ATPase FtsK/SpoIIIE